MADEAGVLNVMEQQISHAQQVGYMLFLDATEAGLEQALLFHALHMVLAHVVDARRAAREAAPRRIKWTEPR